MNARGIVLIGLLAGIVIGGLLVATPARGKVVPPLREALNLPGSHAPTPPAMINFQGRLTDPSTGMPVANGNYSLTFRIFDVPAGGTVLWTENQASVPVTGGIFSVQLGSVTTFPSAAFSGTPYLEVQVASDPPMVPRQPFGSVPFALHAATADSADTAENGVPSGFSFVSDRAAPPAGFSLARTVSLPGDDWTARASMPAPRQGLAAAAVNNKIYAIGGLSSGGAALATVEEYNPATNTWSTKASMPTARRGLGAAAVNNKIYAIGGHNGTAAVATVEEYDPAANTWTTKASIPTVRYLPATEVVDSKVYAIGGTHICCTPVATVEEYDPATNTWTTKASMPTARLGLGAAAVNNKIYAMGGDTAGDGSASVAKVEEYNPAANTWTSVTSMPTARASLAAATVHSTVYAIGGQLAAGSHSQVVEQYEPVVTFYVHQKN